LRLLLHAQMRLARALRQCIAAQRHRSTRGSQGQLPCNTEHVSTVDATHLHGRRHNASAHRSSMRPLPAAAATRVDASSTSAASVHSCSSTQIHPRLARSASSQHRACARWMRRSARSTTQCKCTSMRPLLAAAATRVDASSTSAASVYSCSATQIHPRLARSASPQDQA
jgi:hypothetical protein